MKKTLLQKLSGFRFGMGSMAAVMIGFFLVGYNAMVADNSACFAQMDVPPATPVVVTGGPCPSACATPPVTPPCEPATTSETAVNTIWNAFDQLMTGSASLVNEVPPYQATQRGGGTVNSGNGLEGYLGGIVDAMLYALMDRLNDIELGYIDWFDTMWYYGMKPSMMDMTDQMSTAAADQNRTFQAGQDAEDEDQVNVGHMEQEQRDQRVFRATENAACVGAGAAGGSGRQQNIAGNMRKAMQQVTLDDGLNRRGTPSAKGRGAKLQARSSTYESTFCDPTDNDGGNNCTGATPVGLYNADAQITKTLYGTLTIPLHDPTNGPKYEAATKALLDNLTGDPTPDPMSAQVMKSAQAQQEFIDRRSYIARMAAIRATPQLGIAWRTPGTRLATWVSALRQEGGAQPTAGATTGPAGTCSTATDGSPCEMSDNPSYKEVLHAISIDRFNSGKYANGMTTDESDLEMEKLTIESFYLMQLRDYYELLERMGLTLAVQVSILADQMPATVPQAERTK